MTGGRAEGESPDPSGVGPQTWSKPCVLAYFIADWRRGKGLAVIKKVRMGLAALAASAALAGCVSVGAPEKEGQLAAAGFVRQPADTPLKMTKLQALPQNTIVAAQRKGHNVYIYADAAGCNCAFIGNDAAYQQYQQIRTANNIAQMQETTALLNQEAALDWGGVWGPYAPGWY